MSNQINNQPSSSAPSNSQASSSSTHGGSRSGSRGRSRGGSRSGSRGGSQSESQSESRQRGPSWSEGQTLLLVETYGKYFNEIQDSVNRDYKQALTDRLLDEIRTESEARGYVPRTAKQITSKWDNLRQEFRKNNFRRNSTGTEPAADSLVYDLMYDMLKDFPTYFPPAVFTSLSGRMIYNSGTNPAGTSPSSDAEEDAPNDSRSPTPSSVAESTIPVDQEVHRPSAATLETPTATPAPTPAPAAPAAPSPPPQRV